MIIKSWFKKIIGSSSKQEDKIYLDGNEKQILLNRLSKADRFSHQYEEDGFYNSSLSRIINNLFWLYYQLELYKIETKPDYFGSPQNSDKLTIRQKHCWENCIKNISSKNYYEAYHCFCDFIENYGDDWEVQLTVEEKVILYQLIKQFVFRFGNAQQNMLFQISVQK